MAEANRVLAAALSAVLAAACAGSAPDSGSCSRSTPSSTGPGDVSNDFPLSMGSRWIYQHSDPSMPPSQQVLQRTVEVTGTRDVGGTAASVFTSRTADGSENEVALFAKGPSGVTQFAGPTDGPPESRILPYHLLRFPLEVGTSFEQFSCTNLDYGEDLDGDRRNERLDARSTVSVDREETIEVPAGTFAAVAVVTRVSMTLRATSGQTASVSGTETTWYAPGVGVVRSSSAISDGSLIQTTEDVLLGYAVEGRLGGLVRSATLAADLAAANSNTEVPGRPVLSFDGIGHLLVTTTAADPFGQNVTLAGFVLGRDGATLHELVPIPGLGRAAPAAAFDGTNHLVAVASAGATIVAERVSPAGEPLDGAYGIELTSGGQTVYGPSVASDGDGWLVAWTRYQGGLEIARVSGSGALLGTSVVRGSVTWGWQAAGFGGGVYLLAWLEGQHLLAARVDPSGAVLDDPPIAVATAASEKSIGGIAFDGTSFLVVWGDSRRGDTWINGPAQDVYAARVALDGRLLDGPAESGGIVVNALAGETKLYPSVAFDGTRFVVAWEIEGFYDTVGVFAARVTSGGAVLDGPVSGTGLWIARPTAYASRLVHPVVVPAADGEVLFAWTNNTEASGTTKSVEAAWYVW